MAIDRPHPRHEADLPRTHGRRPPVAGRRAAATAWTALQQSAGNHAIQHMLAGTVLQRACDCGTCERCQARREHGHAHGDDALSSDFLSGKGGGAPLGDSVRDFMESRFGHDFGAVRVHTDAHAARSAREISAMAYTAGTDVFFAPGHYRPDTPAGRHLLAHELTHVIQQGGGPATAQAQLTVGEPDDRYEREADQVADAVMADRAAPAVSSLASPACQRKKFVTGRFTGASAALRQKARAIREPAAEDAKELPLAWNDARKAYESPFTIEAEFDPAPGMSCGAGRVSLYASGWAERTAQGEEAKKERADADIHVRPGQSLDRDWKERMVYVAQVDDCKLSAKVNPTFPAARAGEQLRGHISLGAVAFDEADKSRRGANSPDDRIDWFVRLDQAAPAFKPVESQADAEAKGSVKGEFTSVPRGTLKAHFEKEEGPEDDDLPDRLTRDFQVNARFEPDGGATDCMRGEYRQFARVRSQGDGRLLTQKDMKLGRECMYGGFCEDQGHDDATQRYGHRDFNNGVDKDLREFGPDGKSCLYHATDSPYLPTEKYKHVKMKDEFIGQLVDVRRVKPQDTPYKPNEDGVLAHAEWTVEGEHPAAAAKPESKLAAAAPRAEVKASGGPASGMPAPGNRYDDKPDKGYDRGRSGPIPPEYLEGYWEEWEEDEKRDAESRHSRQQAADQHVVRRLPVAGMIQRKPCVDEGRFRDGVDARLRPGLEQKALVFKDGAWDASRRWLQHGFTLEAQFKPAEQAAHGAHGELHLFASGEASRAGKALASTGAANRPQPVVQDMRIHAQPAEPLLDAKERRLFGRYLANVNGTTARAEILPGVRAEKAGDAVAFRADFVAQLIDTCNEKTPRHKATPHAEGDTLAQLSWRLELADTAPQQQEQKTSDASSAKPGLFSSLFGKKEPPKAKVAGRFTSIPSGRLEAAWDPWRERFGREFYMRAVFEPLAPEADCAKGEYRQFAKAHWERDGRTLRPGKGQPKEVTSRFCEDTFTQTSMLGQESEGRYGRRADSNPPGSNSVYGLHLTRGCLFQGWDYPHMEPSAERKADEKLKLHHEFVGQLIDKSVVDPTQDRPYATSEVLAESKWSVEGEVTVPVSWTPRAKKPQAGVSVPQLPSEAKAEPSRT